MTGTVPAPAAKQTRILRAAAELLLAHGFRGVTISDVARRAHVGKGTVYLYWSTKEELFVELFVRDMLDAVDQVVAALDADPSVVLPRRFFLLLQRLALERPFVRALQTTDVDLMGLLTEHPRTVALAEAPGAVMAAVLPVLREHGVVRDDLAPEVQIYAAQAVAGGFLGLVTGVFPPAGPAVAIDAPEHAVAATFRLLLEPGEPPDAAAVTAAADAARSVVAAVRTRLGG